MDSYLEKFLQECCTITLHDLAGFVSDFGKYMSILQFCRTLARQPSCKNCRKYALADGLIFFASLTTSKYFNLRWVSKYQKKIFAKKFR